MQFEKNGCLAKGNNINQKEITYRVDKNGCHVCTSHKPNCNGYPRTKIKGKTWLMNRYIYTQTYGEIPKGLMVRHKCDNRMCINPEHLELGIHQDNMDDMVRRGRSNNGKGNKNKKLW